jgi:transcriptional regulator with XRE-family HTH domain
MKKLIAIRTKIRLLRVEKGYSQSYVANQLHMSQISYHKLESGKTELKVKTLLKLARILEVSETYFFDSN